MRTPFTTVTLSLAFAVGFCLPALAQKFDFKLPKEVKFDKQCGPCIAALNRLPDDVNIEAVTDRGVIYLKLTHEKYIDSLFPNPKDGFVVDILDRDQFTCGEENDMPSYKFHRGLILDPVYKEDFPALSHTGRQGETFIKVSVLPSQYKSVKDLEFNLIFLKENTWCHYQPSISFPDMQWAPLNMKLYTDTLGLTDEGKIRTSLAPDSSMMDNTLEVLVPFAKNGTEYQMTALRKQFDSLQLEKYDIEHVNILVFSSVEGTTKKNHELQRKRSQYIQDVLKKYAPENLKAEVKTEENWDAFMQDISKTKYRSMTKMSKDQIKYKLNELGLKHRLEPILENHRKAIITLQVQPKNPYTNLHPDSVQYNLEVCIKRKNIQQAVQLQQSLFSKVRRGEIEASALNAVSIPQKAEFMPLLNNRLTFNLENETEFDLSKALREVKSLRKLSPSNPYVDYNLALLFLKAWAAGEDSGYDEDLVLEKINRAKKMGIPTTLVNRLFINYHMLMCESHKARKDQLATEASLKVISSKYRSLSLSSEDRMHLVQFFADHNKFDWAEKLVKSGLRGEQPDEDILFYYLGLTMHKEALYTNKNYVKLVQKAAKLNPYRFCQFFNTNTDGGMSFQLLMNEILKEKHCELCEEEA